MLHVGFLRLSSPEDPQVTRGLRYTFLEGHWDDDFLLAPLFFLQNLHVHVLSIQLQHVIEVVCRYKQVIDFLDTRK